MTLTSALLTATWLYAWRRRLVDPGAGVVEARSLTRRGLVSTAVFVLSVPTALLGLPVAIAIWMGVLPVARRLAERRARPSTTPAPYG
jgi:hypothetical protein